jgi:signal peptidase I
MGNRGVRFTHLTLELPETLYPNVAVLVRFAQISYSAERTLRKHKEMSLDGLQTSFSRTMTHTFTSTDPKKTKRIFWLFWISISLGLLTLFFTPLRVTGSSMSPTLRDGQVLLLQHHLAFVHHEYQKDDLIVLSPPKELRTRASQYVKRVVAASGDSLSIREGIVYLNNQKLYEPYVAEHTSLPDNFPELLVSKGEVIAFEGFALSELPQYLQATFEMLEPLPGNILGQSSKEAVTYIGAIKLKQGFYFVLGDNRGFSASEDSRLFGAVAEQNILGKATPLW